MSSREHIKIIGNYPNDEKEFMNSVLLAFGDNDYYIIDTAFDDRGYVVQNYFALAHKGTDPTTKFWRFYESFGSLLGAGI